MKAKLAAGEPAFGVSVMFPSPHVVEMLGALGFDWVLLDCEHGSLSPESVELMAMAAQASGMTPIARPRTRSAEHIAQVLDRGVLGVQVPHIVTADDARAAVQAAKYHPLGRRSLAAGTRAANYDARGSMADYVRDANEATLIAVQIEDREALPNLDAILAVVGIDVFFIGPSDLSQSMGHPGNAKAAPVAQAIEAALARIRAAGKTPGMPSGVENVREVLGKGVRYVYTHVPRLLAAAARSYLE
ncbi:MAG TPA: aldolase/citrate lyase family protein, partial [Burkholderiales bacterium]|nr:aldolase/citrate lyase family protein [Burkholderiales bacterium]